MRRFIVLMATTMVAMLLLPAAPALAAPPLGVTITVEETIPVTIPGGGGPFIASGDAVDAGVMCRTGTEINTALQAFGSGKYLRLKIVKEFTCDDGSGTFVVKMRVKLDTTTGATVARWNVKGGTGDYSKLRGSGSLVGTPGDPGQIEDVYTGKLKG